MVTNLARASSIFAKTPHTEPENTRLESIFSQPISEKMPIGQNGCLFRYDVSNTRGAAATACCILHRAVTRGAAEDQRPAYGNFCQRRKGRLEHTCNARIKYERPGGYR